MPLAGETVIIAVSGGADSCALALALSQLKQDKKLDLRFVIAHLNHDLRGEYSEEDARFVKALAEKLNFELVLSKREISQEGNLEQNARAERYRFLNETAGNLKACAVLTAHTVNDQAETFLMNLIRGSGIEGLGGMRAVRHLDAGKKSELEHQISSSQILLARPLLGWARREDTENFCHRQEVEFRYDAMNEDLRFQRVRIRKVLLPLLKDFNPKIIENLAKTAELLRLEMAEKAVPENLFEEEELSLKELKHLTKPVLYRRLRAWLKKNRGDLRRLELKHIEAIERLAFSRKSGKMVELPGEEKIIKGGGKLQFKKRKVEK